MVLRKPGKPDYAVPGAYQPISLLNMLGKLLEAVMVWRLIFWANTYKLLPDTQFKADQGITQNRHFLCWGIPLIEHGFDLKW